MILLNKKQGETPLEAIFRSNIPKPATYAGRLDPMAEGLLVVLQGEECKKKNEYLGLDKEYEFEMLVGFGTDTGDLLGMVTSQASAAVPVDILNQLREAAVGYIGKHTFEYPDFSSRTIQGKPLFSLARSGDVASFEKPTKDIKVYSLTILNEREVSSDQLLALINSKISLVKGDFRQKEICKTWSEHLTERSVFKIISGNIHCSSGTYIRTVVSDLAARVAQQGCLFGLKRTKVGSFLLSDAK